MDDFEKFLNWVNRERKTEKIDVDTFVKNHKHICYCEAIIFSSGEIAYVNPSHVDTLLREVDKDRDAAYAKIPITESPIEWLLNYTEAIAVWYNGYMLPMDKKVSKEAMETLEKLITSKTIIGVDMREKMFMPI